MSLRFFALIFECLRILLFKSIFLTRVGKLRLSLGSRKLFFFTHFVQAPFLLFPGGLAETPLHGGLVGPTFACIIGIQFRNLRKCDRFWYETGNPLVRFTESQLAEIRKVTLSKVRTA